MGAQIRAPLFGRRVLEACGGGLDAPAVRSRRVASGADDRHRAQRRHARHTQGSLFGNRREDRLPLNRGQLVRQHAGSRARHRTPCKHHARCENALVT